MVSTTLDKQQKLGMHVQVVLFYSKTLQVSGKLKHKLLAAVPMLRWYFYIERGSRSEKRKMHDMDFY